MNTRHAESHPAIISMNTPRFFVLLLAAFLALLTPRPAQAQAEVSFDFFYDSLAPHGEWIEVADYGNAWRPTAVDEDWAPYTDGYWAFTDAGWTWVSYEEFGGIVYHYGRWMRVEDEGWCWVPDYEWAPAWVSWRQNDDYVGWAPLPPEARWRPSIGISVWVDRQYDIGPGYYSFCRVRDFGAPVLRPVIVNRTENVTIIRRTVNITNITYNTTYVGGPVIYNGGPTYAVANQRSTRRIPALKLVRDADFRFERRGEDNRRERGHDFNARAVGNQLVVAAPTVRPPTTPDWMKGRTKKVVAADKVTRGWSGVRSEEVRRDIRQEMQKQTKGRTPETTPARPMAKTDVQAVPAKADPKAASPVAATPERRDRPEKKDRTPEPVSPSPVTQPMPPTTVEVPKDKPARERGRGPASQESPKPVTVAPVLKPFNPVAETEPKPKREPAAVPPVPVVIPEGAKPANEAPVAMPDRRQRPDRTTDQPEPKTREREVAEQPKRPQAPEADRQKMRGNQEPPAREPAEGVAQQAEAQRKAAAMRQQQEEQNAMQQKKQAEFERAARQQTEAAAAQRQQAEMQQRAAEEAGRARAVEQARAQEMEGRRRQQAEQQAAEQQQRRQVMEQQRAAQEGARQQAERAVGEQRQREMRERQPEPRPQREAPQPPREVPPPQREMQRPPPPAPTAPTVPQEPEKERRGRDKDKDR